MKDKKIDILGTKYSVRLDGDNNNPKVRTNNGYTELYTKEIILCTGYEKDACAFNNILDFREKVFRHEVFHAIFAESGLRDYCEDEVLVDFLAFQYPKIEKIMHNVKKMHKEITKETEI